MQSQEDSATLHFIDSVNMTPLQDLISAEAEHQRHEFIEEQQPVQASFGCISEISLAHCATDSLTHMWPIIHDGNDYGESSHQSITTDDVLVDAKKQHCACVEESTLDTMLEEAGINNRYDDDDWVEEQLSRNQALSL